MSSRFSLPGSLEKNGRDLQATANWIALAIELAAALEVELAAALAVELAAALMIAYGGIEPVIGLLIPRRQVDGAPERRRRGQKVARGKRVARGPWINEKKARGPEGRQKITRYILSPVPGSSWLF